MGQRYRPKAGTDSKKTNGAKELRIPNITEKIASCETEPEKSTRPGSTWCVDAERKTAPFQDMEQALLPAMRVSC